MTKYSPFDDKKKHCLMTKKAPFDDKNKLRLMPNKHRLVTNTGRSFDSAFIHAFMHAYIHTLHRYIYTAHTYIHTYIHAYNITGFHCRQHNRKLFRGVQTGTYNRFRRRGNDFTTARDKDG
jgi:hypothetical protein